jgi:NADH-quinone oxidoreductase subunit G
VDICPVGALTSSDFRFKMRVWFLKETKSICTSCGTGCNTIIGSRENAVYRQTPRENNDVNSVWMCDYGRLNFHYLHGDRRLTSLELKGAQHQISWPEAIAHAASALKKFKKDEIAIIASGRMTNEELWLASKLAGALGTSLRDIVPHEDEGDDILLNCDRNPNTSGAQLLGLSTGRLSAIAEGVRAGTIKALVVCCEDLTECGFSDSELQKLGALITIGILANTTTKHATLVLPAAGFAEKRGSMINVRGRLQRMNRAINPPGDAREDWEILRDLLVAITGSNGIHAIEDVFKQMAAEVPAFAGLSLSKIGELGVQLNLTRK